MDVRHDHANMQLLQLDPGHATSSGLPHRLLWYWVVGTEPCILEPTLTVRSSNKVLVFGIAIVAAHDGLVVL